MSRRLKPKDLLALGQASGATREPSCSKSNCQRQPRHCSATALPGLSVDCFLDHPDQVFPHALDAFVLRNNLGALHQVSELHGHFVRLG